MEQIDKLEAIKAMAEGSERTRAMEAFREAAKRGEFGAKRVFIGKNTEKEALLILSDKKGRPRLCMKVSASGEASLDLFDESGQVIHSFLKKFSQKK